MCDRFCRFDAHIAEMPALSDKAGELLFFCRKADDKAIFRAMLMKPFLLLGSGEADAGNGDIKRQAGLMLAGACGCDGLIGRGEASVARPAGVILLIFGDGVIDQLLLFAVCAVSGGNLEIGNAFADGGGEHLAQRFDSGAVGFRSGILDLHDVGREDRSDFNQIGRNICFTELVASVDQHEKIGRRCLICGECRAAEQKRQRFCACQSR